MRSNRLLAALAIVGVLMVLVGFSRLRTAGDTPRASPLLPTVPTDPAAGRVVSTGSGRGNDVSADFTVPDGCTRQELSYEGTQTESTGGFMNFRVYDATGFPGDNAVGPVDLDEERDGAALWTLKPGTIYSIEITADGAQWSYELTCR